MEVVDFVMGRIDAHVLPVHLLKELNHFIEVQPTPWAAVAWQSCFTLSCAIFNFIQCPSMIEAVQPHSNLKLAHSTQQLER